MSNEKSIVLQDPTEIKFLASSVYEIVQQPLRDVSLAVS